MRNHYNTIFRHNVGGTTDMHYTALHFPHYREHYLDGFLYLVPEYGPTDQIVVDKNVTPSGQRILISLFNLYGEINKEKHKPQSTLIADWCSRNMHPYDCSLLFNMLTEDYSYELDAQSVCWEGRFSVDEFTKALAKLANHFGFYLALEALKKGDTQRAYSLYQEGSYDDTYPFFEAYKHKNPEEEKIGIVSDDPREQLIAEMSATLINAEHIQADNKRLDKEKKFARIPKADDPELKHHLLELFPTFPMRIKAVPENGNITFATDVDSVFDIAWFAFARLLITDVSEEDNYRIFKPKACQYCGRIFDPNGPRQEYCDKPDCQAARKRKNRQDCDARKRKESRDEGATD